MVSTGILSLKTRPSRFLFCFLLLPPPHTKKPLISSTSLDMQLAVSQKKASSLTIELKKSNREMKKELKKRDLDI